MIHIKIVARRGTWLRLFNGIIFTFYPTRVGLCMSAGREKLKMVEKTAQWWLEINYIKLNWARQSHFGTIEHHQSSAMFQNISIKYFYRILIRTKGKKVFKTFWPDPSTIGHKFMLMHLQKCAKSLLLNLMSAASAFTTLSAFSVVSVASPLHFRFRA